MYATTIVAYRQACMLFRSETLPWMYIVGARCDRLLDENGIVSLPQGFLDGLTNLTRV